MESQTIQQINLAYDSQQDRFLMRTGVSDGQEIPIWITYRIARDMFAVLNAEAKLPVAPLLPQDMVAHFQQSPAEATQQFQKEAEAVNSLKNLDFESEYQQRTSVVGDSQLLVVSTQFVSLNHQLSHMRLICANGMSVNINLTKELVLAITRMMLMAAHDAGWQLQRGTAPVAPSIIIEPPPPTSKQALH